jgi:hypothetical protein
MVIEHKTPVTEAMKDLFHAACDGDREAVTQILDFGLFETWVDWHVNVDVRLRALRFACENVDTKNEAGIDAAVGRYEEMFKATRFPEFREETAAMLMETAFGAGKNPKGENG